MGRLVLTREMLLPLTAQAVRAISLPAHLALVALRQGLGKHDHAAELVQVLCRTNLMVRQTGAEVDVRALGAAVMVLKSLMESGRAHGWQSVSEPDAEVIAKLLTIHDRLLEGLPRRWYEGAQQMIAREIRQQALAVLDSVPPQGSSGASA